MRRVREFFVLQADFDPTRSSRKLARSLQRNGAASRVDGWHSSWDAAIGLVREGCATDVAILDGDGSWTVIAAFSRRNFEVRQAELPVNRRAKWRSSKVGALGDFWCNLNCSDYAWDWVGGAEREVPFRLKYLERRAEANPDGLVARVRALLSEVRDWAFGHGKKIT